MGSQSAKAEALAYLEASALNLNHPQEGRSPAINPGTWTSGIFGIQCVCNLAGENEAR